MLQRRNNPKIHFFPRIIQIKSPRRNELKRINNVDITTKFLINFGLELNSHTLRKAIGTFEKGSSFLIAKIVEVILTGILGKGDEELAKNVLRKIVSRIKWKITKLLQNQYFRFITNSPYLSGDSVANICDYVVPFPIKDVEKIRHRISKSKSIFVNGHNMQEVFRVAGDLLPGKIIFSGNSDQNFTDNKYFENQSIEFFCQNSAISNLANLKTVPIGIENIRLGRSGFKHLHKGLSQFKIYDRVLVPPMSPTNSSRVKVVTLAKSNPETFDVVTGLMPTKEYFRIAREYKFIFACEGNGFDTHRLWEILYQNSFPVVLRTNWSQTLEWLELPILDVDSVLDVTPVLLQDFLTKNQHFTAEKSPQLWIPYWKEMIKSKTRSGN